MKCDLLMLIEMDNIKDIARVLSPFNYFILFKVLIIIYVLYMFQLNYLLHCKNSKNIIGVEIMHISNKGIINSYLIEE